MVLHLRARRYLGLAMQASFHCSRFSITFIYVFTLACKTFCASARRFLDWAYKQVYQFSFFGNVEIDGKRLII